MGRKRTEIVPVYKGIAKWMTENDVSCYKFSALCGLEHNNMMNILKGKHNPSKYTIDSILDVTGLTYENAFGEDDGK